MLKRSFYSLAGAITLSLVSAFSGLAQNIEYTPDGFRDGVSDGIPGDLRSPGFEIFGTGYIQKGTSLIIGINSNIPFEGYRFGDMIINWGDLFLNFSDDDFETALSQGNVYGVRFDPNNDSGVGIGIYRVAATKSVTSQNSGFDTINSYISLVNNYGYTPYLGTMRMDESFTYLPRNKSHNVISGGQLLSSKVEYISDMSLWGFNSNFGFDQNLSETGTYTYGIKFDISQLPLSKFIAHLWAECINDGTAFAGEIKSVPEPSSVLALGLVGLPFLLKRKQKS